MTADSILDGESTGIEGIRVLGPDHFVADIIADLARWTFEGPEAQEAFLSGPWRILMQDTGLNPLKMVAAANSAQAELRSTRNKAKRKILQARTLECQLLAASAACVCALRSLKLGREREAWNHAMAAQNMRGVIRTIESVGGPRGPKLASAVGTRAATASHKEDRELKAQGLEYYELNKSKFASKNAAAKAIAKVVPVKERTARDWLINV